MHIDLAGLLIAVLILVLLFGGAKIPALMRGLGKGGGEFRKGLDETKEKAPDDNRQ